MSEPARIETEDFTISDANNFNLPSRKSDSSYYTLQKMNQLHHEIVRRIVVGQKDHQIADALDITRATVQYVKRSPIVKQKLDIMHGARDASTIELQKQISALAPLALHEMSKIMTDDGAPHGVRAGISKDILDRAGFKPANVNINRDEGFKRDQLDEIKRRAKANGILFEVEAEDAEFEESDESEEQSAQPQVEGSEDIEPGYAGEHPGGMMPPTSSDSEDKESQLLE